MRIRDILETIARSGEDFSDHSSGKYDGNTPIHPTRCGFCDAWRAALDLLADLSFGQASNFEPGDRVLICKRAPGTVVATRTQIDVRMTGDGPADGPGPVGTFVAEFVSPMTAAQKAAPPEFTHWRDQDGAFWKRHDASGRARLIADSNRQPPHGDLVARVSPPQEWPWWFADVEKSWGPLVRIPESEVPTP